jgi:hypothetical protein
MSFNADATCMLASQISFRRCPDGVALICNSISSFKAMSERAIANMLSAASLFVLNGMLPLVQEFLQFTFLSHLGKASV